MVKPADPTFHATAEHAQKTLADALRAWLADRSWSEVKRLIAARQVMVDGNLCLDAGRRLRGTEVVKVLAHPTAPVPKDDDVQVRYLDAHVVVVEKPAGMTTLRHAEERRWPARRKQVQPTLDEVLPRIIARRERRTGGKAPSSRRAKRAPAGRGRPTHRAGGPPPPLRAVHRIDRDTSGLVVFARSVSAERGLGRQFKEHSVHRRYLAVVEGRIERARTIRSRLVRDRGDGRRGSSKEEGEGKPAVTHVRPLEPLAGYTLVECRLETGRTHQIRIHLAESGHPLCGDKVYRQPLFAPAPPDASGAPRLALHAAELGFRHPTTGESLKFAMPLPADLAEFVARLRRQAQ
jgi:23S rRNA pseudouridine1911/1915/1917 synthase